MSQPTAHSSGHSDVRLPRRKALCLGAPCAGAGHIPVHGRHHELPDPPLTMPRIAPACPGDPHHTHVSLHHNAHQVRTPAKVCSPHQHVPAHVRVSMEISAHFHYPPAVYTSEAGRPHQMPLLLILHTHATATACLLTNRANSAVAHAPTIHTGYLCLSVLSRRTASRASPTFCARSACT